MNEQREKGNSKPVLIKRFKPYEDYIINSLASPNGENDWCKISKSLKNRTARQCRDRWNNYLNPALNKTEWKKEDDELLMKLYNEKGPQWKLFCDILNGRSINDVRNRCFKLIRKSKKILKKSSQNKKAHEKKEDKKEDNEVNDNNDAENIPIEDFENNLKLNIFDNDIFSNFDSLPFDIDELFQEFE